MKTIDRRDAYYIIAWAYKQLKCMGKLKWSACTCHRLFCQKKRICESDMCMQYGNKELLNRAKPTHKE